MAAVCGLRDSTNDEETTQDEGKQRNEQYFIANKKMPEMAFDSVG